MNDPLDSATLDAAEPAAFAAAMAPLFEGAPAFLDRLAAARPFRTPDALFAQARAIAHAMPQPKQVELINAHPRLGAPPATLSRFSFREQGHDHLAVEPEVDPAAEAEHRWLAAELDRLNTAYEARFGFRYCVHVAGRSRAELLPAMEAALQGAPDSERHRALDAVVDIAIDRARALRGTIR